MAGLLTTAQKAWMQTIVASSLDVQITVQRPPATPVLDSYGHDMGVPVTVGTAMVNVKKPSATTLQLYADIIGSQRAEMLRFMPPTDIREGDQIAYQGKNWMAHGLDSAESYTFTNEVLITTIA
jgi:hypothetical protein